jgi:hypothetical protein
MAGRASSGGGAMAAGAPEATTGGAPPAPRERERRLREGLASVSVERAAARRVVRDAGVDLLDAL